MKMSGRLLIFILIAVFIQGRAPLVTGVQAQGNEQTITLNGVYNGWVEIDFRRSWDSRAPDLGVVENWLSFNYVRSRGSLGLKFVSGKPEKVNINLSLPFYFIAKQYIVPPPNTPGSPCRGYYTFVNGKSQADYDGSANGNSMTFKISAFTFMPESKESTATGTGGNCAPGIASARQAALESAEIEAMLPGSFDWRFEITSWTEDKASIHGTCSSEEDKLMPGAATQCFWSVKKIPEPVPLVVPPRKR